MNARESSLLSHRGIQIQLGVIVSSQAYGCRTYKSGLYGHTVRQRPYVSKANSSKRLKYVKMYRDEDMEFWKNILRSEECQFNIFGSDGKVIVWRTPKEEYASMCTVPTVKYSSGNIKIWDVLLGMVSVFGFDRRKLYRWHVQEHLSRKSFFNHRKQ
jgi:hypothetical protein